MPWALEISPARRPALFALHVSFFAALRRYEESQRIDLGSHYYLGFRLNFFPSLAVFAASTAFLSGGSSSGRRNQRATPEFAEHS